MKFALNGALTIGTLDGANIEIMEEVGKNNIFIFGMTEEEVYKLKSSGYNPREYYEKNPDLKKILDMIMNNYFSKNEPGIFDPLIKSLLDEGDYYCLLADFEDYVACQKKVESVYRNQEKWTEMAIRNVAGIGKFSSDRTIKEYNEEIWKAPQIDIEG